MALSDQQKADIIFHLGWSADTIISGSTGYNNTINNRLLNLTAPVEGRVAKLLLRIEGIDCKLEAALDRLAAKKVDTIELRDDEMYLLRKEKIRVLRELSDLLDIPIMRQGSGGGISVCV